jgi:hypothetical protein
MSYRLAQLNIIEEEFRVRRIEERRRAAYFVIHRGMNREKYKDKR